MNTLAVIIEAEIRRVMQQALQVKVGLLADQLELKTIGLADGFNPTELEDLEFTGFSIEGQGEETLIGRSEHPVFLCEGWSADFASLLQAAEHAPDKSVKPYTGASESSSERRKTHAKKSPLSVGRGPSFNSSGA
jgi:hypothetical protein